MTKLASSLPGGDANGLIAIASALIENPHEVHVVLGGPCCRSTWRRTCGRHSGMWTRTPERSSAVATPMPKRRGIPMRLPSRDPWKQAVRAARAAYGPDFDQDHPRTIVRPRIILTDDEIQRLHEEALMQDWYERARRRRQVTA